RGIGFDQCFDALNRTQPQLIESIHREYLLAGAELIETNTFGANPIRLAAHGLEQDARVIARQGVRIARAAREVVGVNAMVAGSIGPLGKPLRSEEHTSELQSRSDLVCRLLLEKKKI